MISEVFLSICIDEYAQSLAWNEMRLLLARLIMSFDIELTPAASGWIDQKIYVLWEKKPLMCALKEVSA